MQQLCKNIFISILLIVSCNYFSKAQSVNWNDTLQTILSAESSDSVKVALIGKRIIPMVSNGQKEANDYLKAMETIVRKQKNPNLYAELFYSMAVVRNSSAKPEEIYTYTDSCIYYAEKRKNLQFIIRGNRIKGQHLEMHGRLDDALVYLSRAYEGCLEFNSPFETYRTLIALATVAEKKSDWQKAIDYAMKGAEIAEKNSLGTLASAYIKLGIAYQRIGDFNNALSYFEKARISAEKSQLTLLTQVYANIGGLYQTFKKNDEALLAYYQADSVMKAINYFSGASGTYNNVATLYAAKNELDSAKKYFELGILFTEQMGSRYLGRTYLNYSGFLSKNNQDSLALVYAEKAIAEIENVKDNEALAEAIQVKAAALAKLRKYDDAVSLFQESLFVKDSINQLLKEEEIAELLVKYETDKKENEIAKLSSDKKIQQLQLEKQRALIAGNLLEAKQKQQEIDLLNQQQQIQDLKLSQQREALALKELESQTKDRQLKITEQEKLLKESEVSQQKFSKNLILAGSIILLAFGTLGFNLYRINTKRNNEKEKFQLQNQLSEMRLEALRSQMNPHFIFNALNSINRYIIRSDKETASEYLIKFSKLMRLILENSKSSYITLANELEALRLYVEMELLRFDNKFDFNINVAANVMQEKTQIPPMVLQPFIENAIWHGLMNKKEKGTITVNVESKSASSLHVVIEDNGVGRQKANDQKNEATHTGKSFGMQITRDRLAGINGSDKQFRIIDLVDKNNNPVGTRIELEINTLAA